MIAYFQGKCDWAKVRTPDTKYNEDGTYTIDVYLSDEDLDRLQNVVGLQLKVRENEQGKFVKFSRNHKGDIKGEERIYGPPKITDQDNNELPKDVLIGNGSEVICKLEVYNSRKGIAHRLDTVKVIDLVEYDAPEVSATDDIVPF